MNKMMEIILDGKKMVDRRTGHEYLKEKLGFPEYYGRNLDALWDILTSYSEPLDIKLINKDVIIGLLGSYGQGIIDVFQEASGENTNIEFTLVEEDSCQQKVENKEDRSNSSLQEKDSVNIDGGVMED